MTCVLGHERVLDEGAGDPLRRVVERRDGRVVGAAAFEPLYGPAAEVAVALEDIDDVALAARLVEDIAALVRAADLHTMRFAIDRTQERLAHEVLGVEIVDGEAAVRLDRSEESVPSTDTDAQRIPMAGERGASTIDV